ncbi:carboxypeptidase-like regulatory domain-containing protein [Burkholderia stagnalis]|uniref:carboxypeptidase-like regulatory domain-containing protein n=1 Tax=Burkholderia stagnalis TaxID=1503054 RepID=UPI0007C63353|nr:carboxypeptidase-like regulatory domain-containing protein [Burkholderia stagnalis]VWB32056.1 carboxypeptidase regulatory-like domain protein [Burkholderia stagnalis]
MKTSTPLTLGIAALVLGMAAQPAPAADEAQLSAPDHAGQVAYRSGGIGTDQSAEMKQDMRHYSLTLEFAARAGGGSNEYLADIPVSVTDARGRQVLSTVTEGPFLLAALPAGRYSVTATYNGRTQRRSVQVHASSHVHEVFLWNM